MARTSRPKTAEGGEHRLGNLLIKYKGQYFFIPADRIGPPLKLSEARIKKIESNVAELRKYPDDEHNVEFAVQIASEEIVAKIRRRN